MDGAGRGGGTAGSTFWAGRGWGQHSGTASPFPSPGTFAVVSLMTGAVVEQLVPWPLGPNATSAELGRAEERRIGVAAAMAFLVGLLMVSPCPPGCQNLGQGPSLETVGRVEGGQGVDDGRGVGQGSRVAGEVGPWLEGSWAGIYGGGRGGTLGGGGEALGTVPYTGQR